MNALTTTMTFCPSSFQLKLALGSRKYPFAFVRTRLPELERRSLNFVSVVVRSSAVGSNGVGQRSSGNSSWVNANSSADDLSGWANADGEPESGDSKRKQSLVGILGAGAAGVILLVGLTFAALSISKKSTSGYTRLFQPEKPVTKAQAAIALSTGEASAIVSEELARIEAESMAEKAVAAHSALVAQVEKDLNASYEKELALEKEKIYAVEKLAEETRREVEKLRAKREEENLSLMKERAAVDSEMELFSRLRREVEEQLQTLMNDKLEISYEKERLNKLRRDAETESQEITRLQYELEVERKALSMARAWAEDEAKRAREQAKALDEARDRWERQGIKVVVDSDLREEAEAGATWLAAGKQFSVEETIERSENLVDKLKKMADEVRGKCKDTINRVIEKIVLLISNLKERAGELQDAAKSKLESSLQRVQNTSAGFTSTVKESVKRAAGDWKEGVERLSQKFKT
ncbi:UNVERIFIED_CONTAM: hypothetical protein Sindi_2338900 [Sesamum indicum]